MSGKAWLLPLGVIIACIPCLLIPVTAALIAGGAFGGALGLLGVPWVLALVIAAPLVLAVAVMSMRRRASACCEVDEEHAHTSERPAATDLPNIGPRS